MAPLEYWLMRSIRRSLPQGLIDFIHDRGIFRTPGIETRKPGSAAEWYAEQAQSRRRTLEAKTVCVVGFGGSYGVGVYLLELGVRRVILQDPFAALRHARNATLPKALRDKYFTVQGDDWRPDPARLLVLRDHLAPYAAKHAQSADFVVSRAVFEHVEDVEALVQACSLLTKPGGMNFHLVDLRDHYFKYPFEMLCYAEPTWQRWLNASNNLNRFRVPDYRAAFDGSFTKVDIEIRDRLREEFRRTQSRIRKEFLTGDEDIDAAVKILITAVR
jgi:SAM-dependent methyltransferase